MTGPFTAAIRPDALDNLPATTPGRDTGHLAVLTREQLVYGDHRQARKLSKNIGNRDAGFTLPGVFW